MRFNPIVEYVPGKQLVIAYALSRKPLVGRESRIDETELSEDIAALVEVFQTTWPVTESRFNEIRVEISTDPVIKSITDFMANEWPSHENSVPHCVRDYYRERALLSLNDGVTYKLQIVMPPKMLDHALRRLHESHQGISKCRERVASAIWWSGISRDIKRFIERLPTQSTDTERTTSSWSASSKFTCCIFAWNKVILTLLSDVTNDNTTTNHPGSNSYT